MIEVWDVVILEWIGINLHHPLIVNFFYGVTVLGNLGLVWFGYAAYYKWHRKQAKQALLIVAALLCTSLMVDGVIKHIISRPRPFDAYASITPMLIHPTSYSFPSGHASTSFASAVMIALLDPKVGKSALMIAALIAVSRLILCVHYPSDVFAGLLLGTGLACLLYKGSKRWLSHV